MVIQLVQNTNWVSSLIPLCRLKNQVQVKTEVQEGPSVHPRISADLSYRLNYWPPSPALTFNLKPVIAID